MNDKFLNLDYEEILLQYHDGLVNKLRDFGTDYLKLWVPDDEDKILSILNLVYAVYQSNHHDINIKIKNDSEIKKFENLLNQFCDYKLASNGNYQNIRIYNIDLKKLISCTNEYVKLKDNNHLLKNKKYKSKKISSGIDKDYLRKTYYSNHASYINFVKEEDFLEDKDFDYIARYKDFSLGINVMNNIIDRVKFTSKSSDSNDKFILEKFCQIINNLPIQEAYEHGIIKLEYSLRPKNINKKILGIIPALVIKKEFLVCQNLIKIIRKKYLDDNPSIGKNLYDFKPNKSWLKLSQVEKVKKINMCIEDFEKKIKSDKLIKYEKLEYDIRLTLVFIKEIKSEEKSSILFDFELFIRNEIDKRIEVFYQEIKDINKLRVKNMPVNFKE